MYKNYWYGLMAGCFGTLLIMALVGTVRAQYTGPEKPGSNPGTTLSQAVEPLSYTGTPIGTTFSYQGLLKKNGVPFSGSCDMQFNLWNTITKSSLISSQSISPVPVSNGLFIAVLDFGVSFKGDESYIEPLVSCPTSGSPVYVSLGVQLVHATPYALSLREGAVISGTEYTGITINDGASSGNAIEAYATNGLYGWGILAQGSGAGVVGRSTTLGGSAVVAEGSDGIPPNVALEIKGGKIKVSGTNGKPAFVYQVLTVISSCSVLQNQLLDNDPDAIILVTPRRDTLTAPAKDVEVLYSSPYWYLCSPSLASGMRYNVLVINQ